jgi:hypothetical protein
VGHSAREIRADETIRHIGFGSREAQGGGLGVESLRRVGHDEEDKRRVY